MTDLVEVGTKPAGDGRWGQSDLTGNVFEWALDWYANYANQCTDCANITATSYRVIRGGSFLDSATYLRAGYRNDYGPADRNHVISVRCAMTP